MGSAKCKQCGTDKVLMTFGFAGQDMECPHGPWGDKTHGDDPCSLGWAVAILILLSLVWLVWGIVAAWIHVAQ